MSETKICSKCLKEYPKTNEYFSIDKHAPDGFAYQCKECRKNHWHKYYNENIEKLCEIKKEYMKTYVYDKEKRKIYDKEYFKKYYPSHKDNFLLKYEKRRNKKQQVPNNYTLKEWNECKQQFDNKCAYCGKETELAKDHFIALSKGGELSKNNIIPCCKSCNNSKLNRNFFEWYPRQKYYSKERELKILKYLNYNKNKTQQLTFAI